MGSGTGKSDSAYKKKNTLGLFIYGRRDVMFFIPALKTVYMRAGRNVYRDRTLIISGLHENVSTRDDFTRTICKVSII